MPLSKADRQVSRASMLLGTGPTGTSPGTKQTSKDSLKFLFSGSLCLEEGVGPLGGEAWLVLAPQHTVGQWEFDLGVVELLDSWPAALASCNLFHLHDLDGVGTGTVSGTHVSVCGKKKKKNQPQPPRMPPHSVEPTDSLWGALHSPPKATKPLCCVHHYLNSCYRQRQFLGWVPQETLSQSIQRKANKSNTGSTGLYHKAIETRQRSSTADRSVEQWTE